MPSLPQRKLSDDPVFANLMGGDRLPVLRTPQDEPDATKRNGTTSLSALAAALAAQGLGAPPTTYTIAAALAARDAGTLTVGSVIINGTWDNQGDSTVFAFVLEPGLLSATGWLRTTPGSLVLRKFDVSSGATAKLNENEVDFASLLGRPIQRADAIAAMDAKSLVIGSDIVLGTWNGQRGGVLLPVLGPSAYFPIGVIESGGTLVPVVADVRAGTYYLAKLDGSGGSSGATRDPYDVDTAKRKQVIDANVAAYAESNPAYYGCEFVDEVYGPGQPAYYKCMPSAPATTGGATAWKWFRIDIL